MHSYRQPTGIDVQKLVHVASEAQGCLEALDKDHQAAAIRGTAAEHSAFLPCGSASRE